MPARPTWPNLSGLGSTCPITNLDPRFVLVSESDIPLYDPLTLYQQVWGRAVCLVRQAWQRQPEGASTAVNKHAAGDCAAAVPSWPQYSQRSGMPCSHAVQLMSESKSRVRACSQPWTSAYRWSLEMGVCLLASTAHVHPLYVCPTFAGMPGKRQPVRYLSEDSGSGGGVPSLLHARSFRCKPSRPPLPHPPHSLTRLAP